jgi:5-formyltetrahydrofolate cyclo-ligase
VPDQPLPPSTDRRALRQSARAARAALVQSLAHPVRTALEAALAGIALPFLGRPGLLASHFALGDEIDPSHLEAAAQAAGWALAFPRVTGDQPLAFHPCCRTDLQPGFRGISEPPADLPQARPDLLLVPLLAADRQGNRLGQGGGHYDRTLAALRAQGPLRAIGLAWDMQIIDALSARAWDQPLDAIATPTAFHPMPGFATGRA